jgi:glycosyltransferase involved in cell wall biosynthesis
MSAVSKYAVSAIVSVYNCRLFMRGCLEDLVGQSLYRKGLLEIIVINSASTQSEDAIITEFMRTHRHITYIKTDSRETVYQAWNRGIRVARGRYITSANADDRHQSGALEILSGALDRDPGAVLAYADSIVTDTPNQTFDRCTPVGYLRWPDHDPAQLMRYCYIGPQPVWRKSVHEQAGYFSPHYRVAGDYEFWLRLASRGTFIHIPELLGLYYLSARTMSKNGLLPHIEALSVKKRCFPALPESFFRREKVKKPPKLLFVVHNFLPDKIGGVELYAYHCARQLSEKGFEVVILRRRADPLIKKIVLQEYTYEGLRVYSVEGNYNPHPYFDLEHKEIREIFDNFLAWGQFDFVHFQHVLGFPLSLLEIVSRRKIPFAVTVHDFWFLCPRSHLYQPEADRVCPGPGRSGACIACLARGCDVKSRQGSFLRQCLSSRIEKAKKLLSLAAYVACPSRFVFDKFQEYGVTSGNFFVSNLGVFASRRKGKAVRSGDTPGSIVFGYAGRVNRLKNTRALVEAFKGAEGGARLVIWGGGEEGDLNELRRSIAADPRISYAGPFQPRDLPGIFSRVDVMVTPSLIESYSFGVREALFNRVPVIAASVGGIPEAVENGRNGFLFDPRDVPQLRRVLQTLIHDPAPIRALRKQCGQVKSITQDSREWAARYRRAIKAAGPSVRTEIKTAQDMLDIKSVPLDFYIIDNLELLSPVSRVNYYLKKKEGSMAGKIAREELRGLPVYNQIMRAIGAQAR